MNICLAFAAKAAKEAGMDYDDAIEKFRKGYKENSVYINDCEILEGHCVHCARAEAILKLKKEDKKDNNLIHIKLANKSPFEKVKPKALIRSCKHDYSDEKCTVCSPWRVRYPICPTHKDKLNDKGYCKECHIYYDISDV